MTDNIFIDVDEFTDKMLPFLKENMLAADSGVSGVFLGFLDGGVRLQMFPPMDSPDWREPFLWAAHVLCASVAMDAIAMVSDSYAALEPTKTDGSPWGPGDMQRAFESGGPDKELVTECLNIVIFDRTGTGAAVAIKYSREGDEVVFGERTSFIEGRDENVELSGYLSEGLRHAALQETLDKQLEREEGLSGEQFGLDREETLAHMACAGVKTVIAQGIPIALGATSEKEYEIIQRSMTGEGMEQAKTIIEAIKEAKEAGLSPDEIAEVIDQTIKEEERKHGEDS